MAQEIQCYITTLPFSPNNWTPLDIDSTVTFPGLCKFLTQSFSVPALLIYHYPTNIPITNDQDLQNLFARCRSENNNQIFLVLNLNPQPLYPQLKPPVDLLPPKTPPRDVQPFPVGNNLRKVLEHFRISYQQCTTATQLIEALPLPKTSVHTQEAVSSSNRPIYFYQRLRKIAAWCAVPYEELLDEVQQLLEHGKQEQEEIGDDFVIIDNHTDPTCHETLCYRCNAPIRGVRYKCVLCLDYDLCQECDALNMSQFFHDPSHCFIKITKPNTFSWKTVWVHRTQNLPKHPKLRTFVGRTPRPQPSAEEIESKLVELQHKLAELKQQQAAQNAPPVAGQPSGFFPRVSSFFSPQNKPL